MKNLLILPLLLISFIVFSQGESKDYLKNKDKSNYHRGYILINDTVKVQGLIKEFSVLSEARKFSEVVFIPVDGKKDYYYPQNIKGYGYSVYEFFSFGDSFYERVSKGPRVELYRKVVIETHSGYSPPGGAPNMYSTSTDVFFIKKTNSIELIEVRRRKFQQEFSFIFGDCESVRQKILNMDLKAKDIKDIVNEYNSCK